MQPWLEKHTIKLVLGGVLSLFAYVGTTWETRLHERLDQLESRERQLDKIEQKLDDLIAEVRRLEGQPVKRKE